MQVRDPTEPGKATVAGRFVTVGREKKRPSGRLFRTAHSPQLPVRDRFRHCEACEADHFVDPLIKRFVTPLNC